MNVLISVLLFLLLLGVHAVREAVHTSGRIYLQHVLEGKETSSLPDPQSTDVQARTLHALRLARALALTAWVLALFTGLQTANPLLRAGETLLLAVTGDEVARLIGQWVTVRFPRARNLLLRSIGGLDAAFRPLTWVFRSLSMYLLGIEPARDIMLALDEDQILIIAHRDILTSTRQAEREWITNIFDFRETIVREIMVPRLDIIAVPTTATLKEALDTIVVHGHSRVPVYDGSLDNIVGVLYAKDILRLLRESFPAWPNKPITAIMRPPYYVPDSKRVSELLPEMQQNKVHLAIVVDEYGGTAGIVTIEDILEEIVGEIQDEFDREMPDMVRVGENEYIINARADLEDVSDFIGVELPDEYADTLGGFIYTLLNRMPVRGDVVVYPPVRMQVLSVDGRRIRAVRITVDRALDRRGEEASPSKEEPSVHEPARNA